MNSIVFKNLLNKDEIDSLVDDYTKSYTKVGKGYFGLENLLNLSSTKKYHIKFKKIIEDVVGENVDLVCTYMRKYNKGDILEKHIDRTELHHTLSIQLKKSDDIPNPLIIHHDNGDEEIHLQDGDGGLIYESNKIPHSRPALKSEYMYCLFLHYVPTSTKKII